LTTISQEGIPNAAPMGVWVGQGASLTIRPYDETQTAHNVESSGEAVINLSQDPQLFLAFAFKEELPFSQQVAFESAKTVKAPRISGVSGFVEVTLKRQHQAKSVNSYKEFVCAVQHVELASAFPLVHSRARSAAIECVIHATKIRSLYHSDPSSVRRLAHQIDELHGFVERIAPQSPSAEVIRRVESLLPKWMK
jgi:hypothetical protein